MNLYELINDLGGWYVAANDPTDAQNKLMEALNAGDGYGFTGDRKVTTIRLLAEGIRKSDNKMLPYNLSKDNRFLCT